MDKIQARQLARTKLARLSDEEKKQYDEAIFERVRQSGFVHGNVCVYNALKSEVATSKIVDMYCDIAVLYMPIVVGDDMEFVKISRQTRYQKGAFGIAEPIGERIKAKDLVVDICITPMLGGDEKLTRLGKGKGYYDRFFASCDCVRVGLAYETQIINYIDSEPHDIKMDYIITEKRTIEQCE